MKELSFIDGSALRYAFQKVGELPSGKMFTTKRIFYDTIIDDADPRCHGAIMRELERCRLIEKCGSTTAEQTDRHNGLTTLWRKI